MFAQIYRWFQVRTLACGLFLAGVVVPSATAQTISNTELRITSATLSDGQAGVTVRDTFEFTFSRALPFSSITNVAFHFEPRRLNLREEFFFGGDRTVRFRVLHQANTDYVAYAFGAVTCNDPARGQGCFSPMAPATTLYLQKRPQVYNYTTAPTIGQRRVSGMVTFGDTDFPVAKWGGNAQILRNVIAEAYSDVARYAPPPLLSTAATDSLARTVVFLLDRFTLSASTWLPRSGAAPDAAGAFTVPHVRDGQYWPVAIHFADRFGQSIARYGYHDADGDFDPDPITVEGGNVTGLNIILMPDEPILARTSLPMGEAQARQVFADAELHTLTALNPTASGTAALWRYVYYSPGKDSLVTVDASSFSAQAFVSEAEPGFAERLALPDAFANSDEIFALAEAAGGGAFRAQYPDEQVMMFAELGDLPLDFRPARPARFWHIRYESPMDAPEPQTLDLFFDAETGAQLQGTFVSNAPGTPVLEIGLEQPAPHPVRTQASLTYTLTSPGHVRLVLFDLVGRQVAVLQDAAQSAGTHTLTWDAGALAAGTYFVRLQVGEAIVLRPVVVAR